MSVRRLLREVDSDELAEWNAYDQRWPLPDPWQQTARLCRVVQASAGRCYEKSAILEEEAFMPIARKGVQAPEEMAAEFAKLGRL
jgi:hypothetical protein